MRSSQVILNNTLNAIDINTYTKYYNCNKNIVIRVLKAKILIDSLVVYRTDVNIISSDYLTRLLGRVLDRAKELYKVMSSLKNLRFTI